MLEKPSPRIVSDFERIKRIPVPYEDVEGGLRDVCAAINALPYAVTTARSGDTYKYAAEVPADEGFTLLNHGHIEIAFDEHDQRSYAFIKQLIGLVSEFSEIEILPMQVEQGEHPPGWATDTTGDRLVSEVGYKVQVKRDREIDPAEQRLRLQEVRIQAEQNVPLDELQRRINQIPVQSQQIPKEDAERKISQFNEFKQKLTELALESAVDN